MSRACVLVVEDDAEMRVLIRKSLTAYDVIEAADAGEAEARLADSEPDLVVLDWKLPGRWGGEVLSLLRTGPQRLPVIVLTAQLEDHTRLLATYLGADLYLTKPFKPSALVEAVERLLAESES